MKLTPPQIHFTTPEKYWDDAQEGDVCISPSYEVTEDRINAYAVLTGDYTPVHIDEDYAKTTPFGTRVAHGLFGLSIADGLKTQSEYRFLPGMSLGWTWDFLLPIKIHDVLHVRFTVTGLRALGLGPGAVVIVHSSLRALGWVAGGAQAVVEALLETIGGPLLSATLTDPDLDMPLADPDDIEDRYSAQVDTFLDAGYGGTDGFPWIA